MVKSESPCPASVSNTGCFLSFEQNEYATLIDYNNQFLVNSVGDPYVPAQTLKYGQAILSFTRNELVFQPSVAQAYLKAINTDTFLGAPPFCALIRDIRAEQKLSYYGIYYRVAYEIAFNFLNDPYGTLIGWQTSILDSGLNQLSGSSKIPILVGGAPTSECLPLDGAGHTLTAGASPVYKTYCLYRQIAFAPLNIVIPVTPT